MARLKLLLDGHFLWRGIKGSGPGRQDLWQGSGGERAGKECTAAHRVLHKLAKGPGDFPKIRIRRKPKMRKTDQ